MKLLKATDNNGHSTFYKDRRSPNCEFTRDLICLWLGEENDWALKVNGELIENKGWKTLGITLNELVCLKEKSHRKKSIRRLVVWTNRLGIFQNVICLALKEELEKKIINGFKQKLLLWVCNEHFEFRNFDVIASENARRIKDTFSFEGSEVDAMESYLSMQEEQNWSRFRWTAAHCFESLFYKRLNKRLNDEEKRALNYEIATRQHNDLYNDMIYKGGKSGIIWINKNDKRKVLENVRSYDISQAYGGQFVRADDFPLGEIYTTNEPKEEVMSRSWYAFAFEFDKKIDPPIPWIKVFQVKDKWYCLLTKPDFDCMKLMEAKFKERPRIKFQFACKNVGYLNFKVRKLINDLYNERQKLKQEGDKTEKFLKQMNEVIYGKGLQDRRGDTKDNKNFRYFCPQISYHALAKTRYELILMIDRLKDRLVACDSDSIKVVNHGFADFLFDIRNSEIKQQLEIAGFPNAKIGTWKFEGLYNRFIQFEKKVYAYEENGELVCKFAGCNKDQLIKWLSEGRDFDDLISSTRISGGVIQKEICYNAQGNFWVETKYYDYSLDKDEIAAFQARQKIICA